MPIAAVMKLPVGSHHKISRYNNLQRAHNREYGAFEQKDWATTESTSVTVVAKNNRRDHQNNATAQPIRAERVPNVDGPAP